MIGLNQRQKRVVLILGVVAVLLLAVVAIITAIRLQQAETEPVVPSVPKSKPKAAEVMPSLEPDDASTKTWMIVSVSPLTPTPTGVLGITSTPTPTGRLTPTATPTSKQLTQGLTAIPTVAQQSLPEAGGGLPTVGAVVGGLGIILLGLLLLL